MSADETSLENALRRAASAVVASSQKETAEQPRFRAIWGIVQSWGGGSPPQELTLALAGDTTNTVPKIRYLNRYSPVVGDDVYCYWVDNYVVIVGRRYETPLPPAFIFTANFSADSVTKIDPSTFAVVSSISVGSGPFTLATDPAGLFAYVANYSADSVTKIDLSTFSVVGSALSVGTGPAQIVINA